MVDETEWLKKHEQTAKNLQWKPLCYTYLKYSYIITCKKKFLSITWHIQNNGLVSIKQTDNELNTIWDSLTENLDTAKVQYLQVCQ